MAKQSSLFLAMILACENGYQAALMAPTEVLARQHYDGFLRLQEEQGLNFHVVLLTGSNTAREKGFTNILLQERLRSLLVPMH